MILNYSLYAKTFEGVGISDTQKEAERLALEDLSSAISSNVKSNFITVTKMLDNDYQKTKTKVIKVSSNLPIRGVKYTKLDGNLKTKITAYISTQDSLRAYEFEIDRLSQEIRRGLKNLEYLDSNSKYTILNKLIGDIENFNKNKIVAIVLGATNLPKLSITKSDLQKKLLKVLQKVDTVDFASKILTKNIDKNKTNIYILPAKVSTSKEITQFARVMKKYLQKYIKSVKKPIRANYFLKSDYEILTNYIIFTIYLIDKKGNILLTNSIKIDQKAYQGVQYRPKLKDFDTLMQTDFIKSDKLRVEIGFRGYSRVDGIDLYKGDNVDIVIRTNKPICYFLQGYVIKDNKNFSYLLPITDNFIDRVNSSDINQLITIASDIPITAPFGNERLQIFATTMKNNKCELKLPLYHEIGDFYVVGNNAISGIKQTRALNFSKRKIKIEKTEATISWTSFKK